MWMVQCAGGTGFVRRPRPVCFSGNFHPSAVRNVGAAEHLHERALTGTVFANQGHHLALIHFQRNAVQRASRPETLADVVHP